MYSYHELIHHIMEPGTSSRKKKTSRLMSFYMIERATRMKRCMCVKTWMKCQIHVLKIIGASSTVPALNIFQDVLYKHIGAHNFLP